MVYKKIANEEGNYKDKQDVRYDVLEAHEAWTPQGKNVGWDEYPDMEHALEAYGLVYDPLPIPDEVK
jgi:hypothetical protein